jgi:hypothetical protein
MPEILMMLFVSELDTARRDFIHLRVIHKIVTGNRLEAHRAKSRSAGAE